MGRACAIAIAGDGPAFLAVATLGTALAAQAHGMAFLGVFSVQQSGALHLVRVRPRGAWYFICLVPAAAAALSSMPLPSPARATGGWLVAQAAQSFPVGPFSCRFLVGCLFFSAAATKLGWLHPAAGACSERLVISL